MLMASRSAPARNVPVRAVTAGTGPMGPGIESTHPHPPALFGNLIHVAAHARVCSVVVFDHLLRFFTRDADALRESERLDGVCDCEVDDLCEASALLQFLLRLRAED